MNARILVIEDHPPLGEIIKKVLEGAGYSVVVALDGKIALEHLMSEGAGVELVLTDIQMPNMTGTELLLKIKQYKNVPVVLMSTFTESYNALEAHALGAAGFLAKPFQRNELLDLIGSILSKGIPLKDSQSAGDYNEIPIEDFICGSEIKFNIYIRITETKFIKIAHEGEDIERDRINIYKQKGIQSFYLRKEDYSRYLGFSIALEGIVAKSPLVSAAQKLHLIQQTGEILMHHIKFKGLDDATYARSRSFIESVFSVMMEDASILRLLVSLSEHTNYLYTHSLAVSMGAVMIARGAGWTSPSILLRLAMGGFFHDIGKKEFPTTLVSKMDKDLTPDELRLLETHPTNGLEILRGIKSIPDDVIQIAYQHHENCIGTGYPRKLYRSHIHPMARLMAVANEFCKLVVPKPQSAQMNPVEAIIHMQKTSAGRFDPDFIDALQNLFPAPPPPALSLKDRRADPVTPKTGAKAKNQSHILWIPT